MKKRDNKNIPTISYDGWDVFCEFELLVGKWQKCRISGRTRMGAGTAQAHVPCARVFISLRVQRNEPKKHAAARGLKLVALAAILPNGDAGESWWAALAF